MILTLEQKAKSLVGKKVRARFSAPGARIDMIGKAVGARGVQIDIVPDSQDGLLSTVMVKYVEEVK